MEITHVIRGDDHLTNTFRQLQIYEAMGWEAPVFSHIPLIHGPDGAKLSKRHGALGIEAYREMGYLPEALRNYLLRLGWGHGDDEIISTQQAIEWFDLDAVGRAPSRFDFAKLDNLNGHYLREAANDRLVQEIARRLGKDADDSAKERLLRAMDGLKARAKTLKELAENAAFFVAQRPIPLDPKAASLLTDNAKAQLCAIVDKAANMMNWSREALETLVRDIAEKNGVKLGQLAQPLRVALTGSTVSPGIFEVMEVLGREESLGRINDALN